MYVHRACKLSEQELDMEKKAGGFCANCGQSGTIFHVKGTIDYYQHILNGVLYRVTEGVESTAMEAVWAAERIKTAKVKAARKGENWTGEVAESTPVTETAPEAKVALTDKEMSKKSKEILATFSEEEPDKTELDALLIDPVLITEELTEQPLEAEPEPSTNVLSGDIDIGPLEDKIAAKDATIAELEARLAELEKAKK